MTHFDETGQARMVDISAKPVTDRMARARGVIRMKPETLEAIRGGTTRKGDVIAVARVAGIMAAKRTAELIPLCHPIPLTDVSLTIELDDDLPGVRVTASAKTAAQTGVEMEAIVAASVTLLTLFDMVKGLDRTLEISEITVTEKLGGKSGHWVR
ncbi:MAG TPA: cyclic pyranopterin monophosphate synthase MoaC [Gemmatimonadaceae bacterium]